jgi:hypothetical protein
MGTCRGARTWLFAALFGTLGVGCATMEPLQQETKPPAVALPRLPPLQPAGPDLSPAPAKAVPPAVLPAAQSVPTVPAVETNGLATLRGIHQQAVTRYASIDSYIVRLRRREQVGGKVKPEETLLFKFRKEPWSVYFKWLGKDCYGREAVFVKGRYEGKIHTHLAAGDVPFMPAGKRLAFAPDNPLVRGSSRHSITEAGVGNILERCSLLLAALEQGDERLGKARHLGRVQRPEFPNPCEGVEVVLPPGAEPQLPRGGRRLVLFDVTEHLPVLVQTFDEGGQEVEYYCYDHFQFPVRLDDDDFNPDRLWPAKTKGS